MKVITIILGVILAIFGVACIFSPGQTFLATGYCLAILLLVYGIIGIINVIRKFSSPITLFASIPAVIIGGIALFRPGSAGAFDTLILYLFAAWFVVEGIVSIVVSIRSRIVNRGWVWGLIFGIIAVLVGCYSFAHPAVSAIAIGILVGIYLIEAGISMIVLAFTARNVEDAIDAIGQAVQGVGNTVFNGEGREVPYDEEPQDAPNADEAPNAADDAKEEN